MLRPWMTRLAGSWPPLVGGYGYPVAARIAGPAGPAGSVTVTGSWRCGPAARSVQVSFALVSSVRNRSDTISPPKRYWRWY